MIETSLNKPKRRKKRKSSECHWICKYCNKEFTTKYELSSHKKSCELKPKIDPNRWKCSDCDLTFRTRSELFGHIHSCHRSIGSRRDKGIKRCTTERKCPFCLKVLNMSNAGFSRHVNHCKFNPDRKPIIGHKHSEDSRRKLSEAMKRSHESGKVADWNRFKVSYPEKWFMDVIKNEFIDKDYKYNFQVSRYRLDFAWPKKMRYIEIDGDQHYRTQDAIEHDKVRDEYLKSLGWTPLRLSWSYIRTNKEECVKSMKSFIDDVSDLPLELQYKDKRKEEFIKREKLKLEHPELFNSLGRLRTVSIEELTRRKSLIFNSGVDMTKYGWKMKVAKITGLHRRYIDYVIHRYPDEFVNVYKDKHTITE